MTVGEANNSLAAVASATPKYPLMPIPISRSELHSNQPMIALDSHGPSTKNSRMPVGAAYKK
ncbi:hypothetical protein QX776_13425 [Alteromonadaceae bacterium BrNp21-10]|nr:hypothetical protein [Alteromonadaceae bacterium BrNp21-10]